VNAYRKHVILCINPLSIVAPVFCYRAILLYKPAGVSGRELTELKETLATLGFMLFFAGAMLDISGSLFVTQGGVSPATYLKVGIMELVGTIIFLAGIYLIIKTR